MSKLTYILFVNGSNTSDNCCMCGTIATCNYFCNETKLMHYLSSVYSVTITLHVSGLLVAHHQEATQCIYMQQMICVVRFLLTVISTTPADSQLKRKTCNICCIYKYARVYQKNSENLTIKNFTVTPSFQILLRSSPLGCLNCPNVCGLLRRRLWKLGVTVKK
jgi:hypothetical protein